MKKQDIVYAAVSQTARHWLRVNPSGQDQPSDAEEQESEPEPLDGSPQFNLLPVHKPARTHYRSVADPTVVPSALFPLHTDQWLNNLLSNEASLPPPKNAPRIFQKTHESPLMDEVITDLLDKGVIKEEHIVNAFRCFLIAETSRAARFIMDLSPWTEYYVTPPMQLKYLQRSQLIII